MTRLRPPTSLMAQLDPAEQSRQVRASAMAAKYAQTLDRESAYEMLLTKAAAPSPTPPQPQAPTTTRPTEPAADDDKSAFGEKVSEVLGSSAFKAFARNVGSSVGREITRSLFGTARRRR